MHGHGLYSEIFLPANNRRELTRTHRDGNPLPLVPDSQATGEAIFRRARNLGTTPAQIARALDRALAVKS